MEAIIFSGIQASGETSLYRERFFSTYVRLSLDMLRTRRRERLLFEACLAAKQPFIVDNTNTARAGGCSCRRSTEASTNCAMWV